MSSSYALQKQSLEVISTLLAEYLVDIENYIKVVYLQHNADAKIGNRPKKSKKQKWNIINNNEGKKTDKFSVHEVIKCCFFVVFFLFGKTVEFKNKIQDGQCQICLLYNRSLYNRSVILFVKMKYELSEPRLFTNVTSLNR